MKEEGLIFTFWIYQPLCTSKHTELAFKTQTWIHNERQWWKRWEERGIVKQPEQTNELPSSYTNQRVSNRFIFFFQHKGDIMFVIMHYENADVMWSQCSYHSYVPLTVILHPQGGDRVTFKCVHLNLK